MPASTLGTAALAYLEVECAPSQSVCCSTAIARSARALDPSTPQPALRLPLRTSSFVCIDSNLLTFLVLTESIGDSRRPSLTGARPPTGKQAQLPSRVIAYTQQSGYGDSLTGSTLTTTTASTTSIPILASWCSFRVHLIRTFWPITSPRHTLPRCQKKSFRLTSAALPRTVTWITAFTGAHQPAVALLSAMRLYVPTRTTACVRLEALAISSMPFTSRPPRRTRFRTMSLLFLTAHSQSGTRHAHRRHLNTNDSLL